MTPQPETDNVLTLNDDPSNLDIVNAYDHLARGGYLTWDAATDACYWATALLRETQGMAPDPHDRFAVMRHERIRTVLHRWGRM